MLSPISLFLPPHSCFSLRRAGCRRAAARRAAALCVLCVDGLDKKEKGQQFTGRRNTDVVPFPLRLHGCGTSSRSSAGTALPTTVLKSESTGREKDEGDPPRAAMGAHGEFCLGRERGWRGLGQVAEGVGVLTVEAIGLRWAHVGDWRGDPSSVLEQRR